MANNPDFRPMGDKGDKPVSGTKQHPGRQPSHPQRSPLEMGFSSLGGFFPFMSRSQETESILHAFEKTGTKGVPGPLSRLRTKPLTMPSYTFLILWLQRPGAAGFVIETERSLFPPATSKNALFNLDLIDWTGMRWYVIHFPTEYRNRVEILAKEWGLQFGLSRSIPREIDKYTGGVKSSFPLVDHDNVFTVENIGEMDRKHDFRFLEKMVDMYTSWARQLPVHRVDILSAPDPVIQQCPCIVCDQEFVPGDAVALIGEDPAKKLYARVHAEHIADVLPTPNEDLATVRSRDQHLQWSRNRAHYAINQGRLQEAFAGFADDLRRHPDTANHPALVEGYHALLSGDLDDPKTMRMFLEVIL